MVRIIGSYLSPYVRKVLVCLHLKHVAYEIDPIVPFYGNDRFSEVSPVRRIPVLIDGELALPDSTVICEYLDDRYPGHPLYPRGAASRGRARWLEEYAGSRMGEVFIWRFFNELVIKRFVWGEATDQAVVRRSREVEIPEILNYLETIVPRSGFLFGEVGAADVAIATFFRNIELSRAGIDMGDWPNTGRFVTEVLSLPGFQRLRQFENLSATTPILEHREALKKAGAPVSAESFFGADPRRGVLSTG